MKAELIETLLRMNESEMLDFKSQQYPFVGASDDEKSELLKDILAFANAWKTSDAYILIGIEEAPGGRATVQGITEHFDDADLQQFVNSKTNATVNFSYLAVTVVERSVGVIRIKKKQRRPVYLTKKYGRLKQGIVYIRLGSSTGQAKPEEIAAMGGAETTASIASPTIELGIGIPARRENFGTEITVYPTVLVDPPQPTPEETAAALKRLKESDACKKLMEDPIRRATRPLMNPLVPQRSPQEIRRSHQELALLVPIGFVAQNTSQTVALDVRVEIEIPLLDDLLLVEEEDHPKNQPTPTDFLFGRRPQFPVAPRDLDLLVSKLPDKWLIEVTFGKIQPHAQEWIQDIFYIGSKNEYHVDTRARIYADNLPQPTQIPITIHIQPKQEIYDPVKWITQDQ